MRVAFFTTLFPKLSEPFVLDQIVGLIDRGHEVDIYAARSNGMSKLQPDVVRYELLRRTHYRTSPPKNYLRRLIHIPGLFVRKGRHNPGAFFRALNVRRYGRRAGSLELLYTCCDLMPRREYDIVHAHFGPNGAYAADLRDLGVLTGGLVTTFHGYDATYHLRAFGPGVYGRLFESGEVFTVNTGFTGQNVVKLGCPPEKIIVLPVGLHLSRFAPRPRSVQSNGEVIVLTVARLVEKKGVEYAVQSMAKVGKRHPNARLLVVGDGPLRGQIEALIQSLAMGDNVELLGWKDHDELRELYAKTDVFMLPSVTASNGDMEGQGLVLQEAQAMCIPVVSTLHNGIPEGVQDGVSGFLVPERDPDALADRLIHLIEQPRLREEMGRAGRQFMEQKYDLEKLNDRLVEIYQNVIKFRGAGR